MVWAPDYATVDQLKGWLRIADNVDDTELQFLVTAASRAIDTFCGRQFGQVSTPEARTYTAIYKSGRWVVPIDDLQNASGATVTAGASSVTDFTLRPLNGPLNGFPYTELTFTGGPWGCYATEDPLVEVTATWGWTSVPDTIIAALKLQANRFLARRDSPFGVAGSPDQGNELRLLARVDPDVELMLAAYRRRWWVA